MCETFATAVRAALNTTASAAFACTLLTAVCFKLRKHLLFCLRKVGDAPAPAVL
jgi:hypothetical protein